MYKNFQHEKKLFLTKKRKKEKIQKMTSRRFDVMSHADT